MVLQRTMFECSCTWKLHIYIFTVFCTILAVCCAWGSWNQMLPLRTDMHMMRSHTISPCICIFNQLESYKMYYKRLKVTSEEPSTFFLSWFVFVYLLSSLSPSFTLSLSLSVSPCSGTVSPLSGGHSSWCQQVRVWLAPPLTTSCVIKTYSRPNYLLPSCCWWLPHWQ